MGTDMRGGEQVLRLEASAPRSHSLWSSSGSAGEGRGFAGDGAHMCGFLPGLQHSSDEGFCRTAPSTQGCPGNSLLTPVRQTVHLASTPPSSWAIGTVGKAKGWHHRRAALLVFSVIFHNGHCWNQPEAPAPVNLVLSGLPQAATPSCFPPVKVMPASEGDTDDVSWTMTFQSLV